jgi:hypothetical protein
MSHVRLTGNTDVFRKVRWRSKDRMRFGARRLVTQIVVRTTSGRDTDGRKFTPYSAAYAKAKGVSPSRVTLVGRGSGPHMLDELDVIDVSETGAVIGWSDAALAARADYVQNGRVPRPFLALEDEWIDEFVEYIADGVTF